MQNKKLHVVFTLVSFAVLLSFLGLVAALGAGSWARLVLASGGFLCFLFMLAILYRHNKSELFKR